MHRCASCRGPVRGQSGNGGIRYYQCANQNQHRVACDQPMVQADVVEAQMVDWLLTLRLATDWEQRLQAYLHPDLEPEELQRREERVRDRLARATELYLAGDLSQERYLQEKKVCQTELAGLVDTANQLGVKLEPETEGAVQ